MNNKKTLLQMNKDLIINQKEDGVEIALLEDKRLVELHKEHLNASYTAGDVYLGQVKKIMAGLNAVFVDVGAGKDGFLHYLDLGHNFLQMQNLVSKCVSGNTEALKQTKENSLN